MSVKIIGGVIVAVSILYTPKVLLTRKGTLELLPPGPSGMPVLGNIFDLTAPDKPDWEHWTNQQKIYGPISSLTVMGKTVVIIHDMGVAKEILEKRSKNYSSRPELVFASETSITTAWNISRCKNPIAYRKAINPCIGTYNSMSQFDNLLEVESLKFLLRVLATPGDFVQHIRKQAGAIIFKIVYGYTVEPHEDEPLVDIVKSAMGHFSIAATPGAWLVDIIPVLRYFPAWLPGAGFKRFAQAWKNNLENVVNVPYKFMQQKFMQDRS